MATALRQPTRAERRRAARAADRPHTIWDHPDAAEAIHALRTARVLDELDALDTPEPAIGPCPHCGTPKPVPEERIADTLAEIRSAGLHPRYDDHGRLIGAYSDWEGDLPPVIWG